MALYFTDPHEDCGLLLASKGGNAYTWALLSNEDCKPLLKRCTSTSAPCGFFYFLFFSFIFFLHVDVNMSIIL